MAREDVIKIRYKPRFGIREIDPFIWKAENDFVQEVPVAVAALLWSYPDPNQFEIAEEDMEKAIAKIENYINGLKN